MEIERVRGFPRLTRARGSHPSTSERLAVVGGVVYLDRITTASTLAHEYGHKLFLDLFYNGTTEIQADGLDNARELLRKPSTTNLLRFITKYDVGQDKASGWAAYSPDNGLTELGREIGKEQADLVITSAGCITVELIALGAFVLGYRMRRKRPLAGLSLMLYSTYLHLLNSTYALSAMVLTPEDFPGHDWIAFSQLTGLHPAVAGVVMTSLLPALYAILKLSERKAEQRALRRQALLNLLGKGIPAERVEEHLKTYPRRDKLKRLSEELYDHLRSIGAVDDGGSLKPERVDERSLKLYRELSSEHERFLDSLLSSLRDSEREMVESEVKRLKAERGGRKPTLKERLTEALRYASRHKLRALSDIMLIAGEAGLLLNTAGFGLSALLPASIPLGVLAVGSGLKLADKARELKAKWSSMSKRSRAIALASALLSSGVSALIGVSFISSL